MQGHAGQVDFTEIDLAPELPAASDAPRRTCRPHMANLGSGSSVVNNIHNIAKLSERPSSLYTLWQEYIHGLDGRKAAKDFTSAERGCCRAIYCFRNSFWSVVANMVRSGLTSDAAIAKVQVAYGDSQSVANILQKMRADKSLQGGAHPSLIC